LTARGRIYCLDSWAILRFLEGHSGAARRVRQVMKRGRPVMSWINLGEVYYTVHRAAGAEEADTTLALLRPMLALDAVTTERVLAAARIKATHPLAYGDAFAVATAAAHGAVLLTGDPEMTERSVGCGVEDLRRF
jgi:predicted nucleic acid-binding protein